MRCAARAGDAAARAQPAGRARTPRGSAGTVLVLLTAGRPLRAHELRLRRVAGLQPSVRLCGAPMRGRLCCGGPGEEKLKYCSIILNEFSFLL